MVTHIDLFDDPSWDSPDFWDYEPKPRSLLAVAAQLTAAVVAGLTIPLCFVLVPGALMWGFDKMFSGWSF